MKILKLIFTFCLFNYLSFSQTFTTNEYYKLDSNDVIHGSYFMKCNDNILSQGYFDKGKPAGKWKFFNYDGQKLIDGYYLNGLMNGRWTYYKDNMVISQIEYRLGILHGKVSSNYLNGNPRIIYNYINGILDGEVKFFYENGHIKEERHYDSGMLDSIFIIYDKNYQESIKIIFDRNRPISILNDKDVENFGLKFQGNLLNGNGKYKSFLKKSGLEIPLEERNYVNGKLSGSYISYYNGIKVAVGNFENDLMIGKWKFYNQNGELVEKNEFLVSDNKDFNELLSYQYNISEFDFTKEFYFISEYMPLFLGQEILQKKNSGIFITTSVDIKQKSTNFDIYLNSKLDKLSINSTGNVFVEFTVGLLGEIKDVKIIRGFSDDENEQILNVFRSLPFFEPGYLDGFPVNVKYTKPIHFD